MRRRLCSTRKSTNGFTLLEVIVVISILAVLTAAAVPMVRNSVKREREAELRIALRQLREAIDAYHRLYERTNGTIIPLEKKTTSGYPPDLDILIDGFYPANQVGTSGSRIRFLRRMPEDPTREPGERTDWGMRSFKDKPDSTSWGGEDVFDVFSKSTATGLNGRPYTEW